MTFTFPMLLLLLAIPALMLWAVPYRTWGLLLPFDHQLHPSRRWLSLLLSAFDCLPALLLAAAIVILAGPQTMQQPKNARKLTNIQFCLDVSGSMMMENRSENARKAIEDFIAVREGDAFGLTIFGSQQIRWTPLTKDLSAVRNALPFANPSRQPSHMGGTMIGAALRFCKDNMMNEAEQGDRIIILVSDGDSFDLAGDAGGAITDELKQENIRLYHIHVATDPIPDEVVDIARETGGEAFQATDALSLKRVFTHIDRMKPAEFRTLGTVPLDHFQPFAIVALAFLGLHVIGLLGARYTPW